jgi:hypothetical protein
MLALIAHDAGGAEILSSYVRRSGIQPLFALHGPARAVFERKLGAVPIVAAEEAVRRCTSVLCGTSWQSELEFDALGLARELGKPSAAFIDHWVNYPDRFVRRGVQHLPGEIWVGDEIAETLAKAQFATLPVRRVENPYFEDVRAQLVAYPPRVREASDPISVLYVCEPVSAHALRRYGDARHFGYLETEAMRFFLANLGAFAQPVAAIRIRPHPAEPADKYAWVSTEFDLPIETGGQRGLIEEIADCDVVVGCESMAMVIGLLAGKQVFSSIPPGGTPCRLPQPQIVHFRDLVQSERATT